MEGHDKEIIVLYICLLLKTYKQYSKKNFIPNNVFAHNPRKTWHINIYFLYWKWKKIPFILLVLHFNRYTWKDFVFVYKRKYLSKTLFTFIITKLLPIQIRNGVFLMAATNRPDILGKVRSSEKAQK